MAGTAPDGPLVPRAYTLTHSDRTGDMYLTVGDAYNQEQVSGWYTRFMRDEVLAEWQIGDHLSLHVHCHVSGGIVFGLPGWREAIFRQHMVMVLEAFRHGDQHLYASHPELDEAAIFVYFHRAGRKRDTIEDWGQPKDYRLKMFD
jgi:hypothetical protein